MVHFKKEMKPKILCFKFPLCLYIIKLSILLLTAVEIHLQQVVIRRLWTSMDDFWTSMDVYGQKWTKKDKNGQKWTKIDVYGRLWT